MVFLLTETTVNRNIITKVETFGINASNYQEAEDKLRSVILAKEHLAISDGTVFSYGCSLGEAELIGVLSREPMKFLKGAGL